MTPDSAWLERLARKAVEAELVDVVYGEVDTPIGKLFVAQSPTGVCRIAFEEEEESLLLEQLAGELSPRIVRSDDATRNVRDALGEYLRGRTAALEIPVDLSLAHSPFRRSVLEQLRRVRRGEVVTYGQLAQRAGSPRAARAVGSACATNPVPIVVPCHRVLPSTGQVGQYGGGPERKRFLLELEGALAG